MLCLSQSVGYAIQALSCLEGNCAGKRLIRDVAACSGVPAPYLTKLFQKLSEAGIVVSKRGYKGGIRIAKPPEEISLFEVTEAIDGRKWLGRCLLGLEECSDDRACPTHDFWKKSRREIELKLRSTTIADVFTFETKRSKSCKSSARKPAKKPTRS